jgi:hypothetical protein
LIKGAGTKILAATIASHLARVPEVSNLLQMLKTEALQVRKAGDVGEGHLWLVVLVMLELVCAL